MCPSVGQTSCFSGIGTLPYTINAELHLPEANALASSFCISFTWFNAFIVTMAFSSFVAAVGAGGAFLAFAVINFLGN